MKLLLTIFLLCLTAFAHADEVKIELNPKKPVAGEPFQAYVRIFTESDEEPIVNFTPSSLEVVGKYNQGVSTRTVYANGKLTVTREVIVVYELVSQRAGISSMRDITVQLGASTLRHPAVSITVLKEPEVQPDVFLMADVPKKELFVGEGVVVRYYLYSKGPVMNLDVKKYPKLDNFLKRFIQEPDVGQRVSVDGQVFSRHQIYAAKLFPEKAGELKIDPLHISVSYPNVSGNDPFASLGFSRDMKTRTISSEVVKLQVRPLPEPVPAHFTGLIGKHDFDIQFNQNKLIVNQPLEVKLIVNGGGALENLEAPPLFKHPGLEEFETNGDLKIANADQATKTFDYTFLAKENFKIPASSITLSYFDSSSGKYVPIQLAIPELEAAGGSVNPSPEKKKDEGSASPKESKSFEMPKPKDLTGPLSNTAASFKQYLPYFNVSLAVLSIVIALGWVIKKESLPGFAREASIPQHFKKGDFSLGEFTKWISPIIQKTGKSPIAIIRDADMDNETKTYFIDLLNSNDYKDYSTRKTEMAFKYHPGHFKKLGRYIESIKNENPAKPT